MLRSSGRKAIVDWRGYKDLLGEMQGLGDSKCSVLVSRCVRATKPSYSRIVVVPSIFIDCGQNINGGSISSLTV